MIQTEEKMLKAVGQFFYGDNFNELAFVVARGINGFKLDKRTLDGVDFKKTIQSVRWLANFTPKESGVYTFTINPHCFAHILIDGENAKDQEIQLEAGKSYPFVVAYFGNPMTEQEELLQLDVHYTFNQQETKEIEVETFSIPEIISFESLPMGTDSRTENKLPDTDEDGICDEWEVNGYYVKNNIAVFPWPKEGSQEEKELIKQGFKKFVSNPYESHTAGDPYSDLEKASGALDRTIHKVARDPLVAAYPSITVGMEELILSNNENISSTKGKTVSRSTSSSVSDSNTLGIDVSTGFSLFQGFSASVTGHYSHSSTHTVDSSNTSGQDWQHQLELNTGQSAYMNANVRYYNTGTAPVYNLVPTTNLVLGRQTIATVTGQLNQRSLSLTPGQTYPKQHLHGVALNTIDQFSSAPIALNINQLDRLESGEKLKLETTQFQGAFAKRSPAGGQVVLEENEWAHYMPQIESMTAGILINMGGNRFIERRVAAKDPLNPNDRTPELTLGEALEKSIGMFLDKENKNFYFIDEETGNRHIISPDLVHLVFDKKTEKKIKEEQERKPDIKTIYGMTIRPEMNIQINVPVLYDDFTKNSDKWSGGDYDTEHALYKGQCYEIGKEKEGVYRNFSLERNATYLIVMAVKGSPTKDKNIIVEIDGITGVKEFGNFKVDKDYKYEKMVLKTFGDMENHLKLHIKNNTNDPIYIDNFSIVKIGRGIDELEKENIEYAKNIKYTDKFYIYGISGEKIITNDRSLPVMKNKGETEQQKFSIQYWGNGTCKIIDTSTGHVLTWIEKLAFLVFSQNTGGTHKNQFWYLKKSTNPNQMGYQIINYLDRSKVLEYDTGKDGKVKDGGLIRIATLDENKPSQYFKFPQKV